MQQSALRSLAIVCDHMETTLFAIVCDLRFAIRDRLRSSTIIWKPALNALQTGGNLKWRLFEFVSVWTGKIMKTALFSEDNVDAVTVRLDFHVQVFFKRKSNITGN